MTIAQKLPRNLSYILKMLDSTMPYYHAGLENRLCYEITFNSYDRVIYSSPGKTSLGVVPNPEAKYKISNISLEYEIVTHNFLSSQIKTEYSNMALLYDRVLRHRQIRVNKSDTTWNWSFNTPCRSLKGILVIFEEETSYKRVTNKFYNPKIKNELFKRTPYCVIRWSNKLWKN